MFEQARDMVGTCSGTYTEAWHLLLPEAHLILMVDSWFVRMLLLRRDMYTPLKEGPLVNRLRAHHLEF